jgi:co-chaperonin GroES (HSP10)
MKVMHDNVFVKVITPEETKVGSIYVPSEKWDKLERGTVVDVGPGTLNGQGVLIKTTLKKGQVVVYPRDNFRNTIDVDNVTLQILRESDILYSIGE